MNKKVPILYERKDLCCGCGACFAICSKQAIRMESDSEGFEYPVIDNEKCVGCMRCTKVCPIKTQNI